MNQPTVVFMTHFLRPEVFKQIAEPFVWTSEREYQEPDHSKLCVVKKRESEVRNEI